jgi:hypothetical protein
LLPARFAFAERPQQCLVELAFERDFGEVVNPIAQPSFDRVEPVVETSSSVSAIAKAVVLLRVIA